MTARSLLTFILVAASAALLTGCSTNPTTGRSELNFLSRSEEIRLGTEAAPQLTQEFGGAVANPQLQAYVANIGRELADQTEGDYPSLPWEFTLLDSEVVNAFALPGGKVFISRGLAKEMTNEAQMAAVLGHEVGHVTARHANARMGNQLLLVLGGTAVGAGVGAAAGGKSGLGIGAAAGGTVGGIAALSYSRDQEIEADRLGMRYMERLKYDPSAAIEVQQLLGRLSGGGGGPEILATHPSSETRINELRKRMQKYYQHTVGNPEFQKHEERFRTQFLARLAALPEPAHGQPRQGREHSAFARIVLADPTTWCAHCAAAAAVAAAPR